jgi:hypothetical protein
MACAGLHSQCLQAGHGAEHAAVGHWAMWTAVAASSESALVPAASFVPPRGQFKTKLHCQTSFLIVPKGA